MGTDDEVKYTCAWIDERGSRDCVESGIKIIYDRWVY